MKQKESGMKTQQRTPRQKLEKKTKQWNPIPTVE